MGYYKYLLPRPVPEKRVHKQIHSLGHLRQAFPARWNSKKPTECFPVLFHPRKVFFCFRFGHIIGIASISLAYKCTHSNFHTGFFGVAIVFEHFIDSLYSAAVTRVVYIIKSTITLLKHMSGYPSLSFARLGQWNVLIGHTSNFVTREFIGKKTLVFFDFIAHRFGMTNKYNF